VEGATHPTIATRAKSGGIVLIIALAFARLLAHVRRPVLVGLELAELGFSPIGGVSKPQVPEPHIFAAPLVSLGVIRLAEAVTLEPLVDGDEAKAHAGGRIIASNDGALERGILLDQAQPDDARWGTYVDFMQAIYLIIELFTELLDQQGLP
jgi:hypothetical protein